MYVLLSKQLPLRIKRVWRKTIFVTTSILLLVIVSCGFILNWLDFWNNYWLIASVSGVSLIMIHTIISLILIPYRYTFNRYEITNEDLAFQKGYFFRSTTFVPINRIQHIETEQGPFLRKENLIELRIHTAATTHHIAGLDIEEAQELRNQIIALVKVAKEDV